MNIFVKLQVPPRAVSHGDNPPGYKAAPGQLLVLPFITAPTTLHYRSLPQGAGEDRQLGHRVFAPKLSEVGFGPRARCERPLIASSGVVRDGLQPRDTDA